MTGSSVKKLLAVSSIICRPRYVNNSKTYRHNVIAVSRGAAKILQFSHGPFPLDPFNRDDEKLREECNKNWNIFLAGSLTEKK